MALLTRVGQVLTTDIFASVKSKSRDVAQAESAFLQDAM